MKRRVFMGLVLSLPTLGTAVAQAVQDKLTPPEIEALLGGNTIVGTWSGTPYRQYYGPDGTTLYVPEGGRADEGRWRTNEETGEYESWWRSTGWTPYALVRTEDGGHAWINGDGLEPFSVVPGRQIE
ncbi:hypothetical protein C6W92_15025 [Roseovarius sp. A46]|uniref:hypothetical protein n=1 Tax=Roseovarius sp. A46 TaxID=2109331 RepID=UPI001010784E|nr:hypothetical protein [Roseovarius sp. A46]RXV59470.1 hypothetical protein C6W92_15025 [Roseovarius sp. A46]